MFKAKYFFNAFSYTSGIQIFSKSAISDLANFSEEPNFGNFWDNHVIKQASDYVGIFYTLKPSCTLTPFDGETSISPSPSITIFHSQRKYGGDEKS